MAPPLLESFICPISQELMEDPVVASDGHSYERESIETWFELKYSSPVTNAWLSSTELIPNHTLRAAIQELRCHPSSSQLIAFRCPISTQLMQEPVIALDGYSYERNSIKDRKWLGIFTKKPKSPITRIRLNLAKVLPNYTVKQAISELQTRVYDPLAEEIELNSPVSNQEEAIARSVRTISSPSVVHASNPPSVYQVVQETHVLWSPNLDDRMGYEFQLPLNTLLVGVPLIQANSNASYIEIDGDALGLLIDTAYVAVYDRGTEFLERLDPCEEDQYFRIIQPVALNLWPTVCPVEVLAWLEEDDFIETEAHVQDHLNRRFYRSKETKCWLYIDSDNAISC